MEEIAQGVSTERSEPGQNPEDLQTLEVEEEELATEIEKDQLLGQDETQENVLLTENKETECFRKEGQANCVICHIRV